jgi:hypothetical protein
MTKPFTTEGAEEHGEPCGLSQEEFELAMEGLDKLSSILAYLEFSRGIDTPRAEMQANLDARIVLIKCKSLIITDAERKLGATQ